MDIVIRAGWPFQFPELFVHGVNASHSTPDGYICLWRDGDDSLEWYTLKGFYNRIEEWRHQDQEGWPNQNLTLDAYLNYPDKISITATFDLSALQVEPGKRAELHGVRSASGTAIALAPGKSTAPNRLHGIWLHAGTLHGPPPRRLSEVPKHLNRSQAGKLEQGLKDRLKGHHPTKRGYDLILFCWNHNGQPNALALLCDEGNGKTEAFAMMPGPNDLENLMLRAGPDALLLKDKRAVLFGAGALGRIYCPYYCPKRHRTTGHRRPGRASTRQCSPTRRRTYPYRLAQSRGSQIRDRRPCFLGKSQCLPRVHNDARADTPAHSERRPGNQRFGRCGLTSPFNPHLNSREKAARFRSLIPRWSHRPDPTPSTPGRYAAHGTARPCPVSRNSRRRSQRRINNSGSRLLRSGQQRAPAAVISCAARLAQVAIDALTERFQFGDEVISVYRPIETAPFDQIKEMGTPPPPKQQ